MGFQLHTCFSPQRHAGLEHFDFKERRKTVVQTCFPPQRYAIFPSPLSQLISTPVAFRPSRSTKHHKTIEQHGILRRSSYISHTHMRTHLFFRDISFGRLPAAPSIRNLLSVLITSTHLEIKYKTRAHASNSIQIS